MPLGTFEKTSRGECGFLIGYNPQTGQKCLISETNLNLMLKKMNVACEVKTVVIHEETAAKKLYGFLARLVPSRVKRELLDEIIPINRSA